MKNEILNKLERLEGYVKILNSYKRYSVQDIKEDFTLRGAIERYLEISLECCIDIGEMIISSRGLRKPETYKEVIEILGEEGILPEGFAVQKDLVKRQSLETFRFICMQKLMWRRFMKYYKAILETLMNLQST